MFCGFLGSEDVQYHVFLRSIREKVVIAHQPITILSQYNPIHLTCGRVKQGFQLSFLRGISCLNSKEIF